MKKQIDWIIIGAQKAGTTSLNNYLNAHPDILGHPQVEFAYFRSDTEYSEDFEEVFDRYFTVGSTKSERIILAKNVGIYDNEVAIKRLKEHNPTCNMILLLRNPVERAYSSYTMEISNRWLKKPFSDVIKAIEDKDYHSTMYRLFVGLGLYVNHLKVLLKYFPKEQVHIYLFDDLKKDANALCQDIFNKMGIDATFKPQTNIVHNKTTKVKSARFADLLSKLKRQDSIIKKIAKQILPYSVFTAIRGFLYKMNKSSQKYEPISKEHKAYLTQFFLPYNQELEALIGIDLDHWNQ